MKPIRLLCAFLLVLVLTAQVATASPSLVTNGLFNGLTGWTTNTPGSVTEPALNPSVVPGSIPGGSNAVQFYGGNDVGQNLYQTIATGTGNTYQLVFYYAEYSGSGVNVAVGNQNINFTGGNDTSWTQASLTLTALSPATTLTFTALVNDDLSIADVSMTQLTAVPEPASFPLLGLFGALGAGLSLVRKARYDLA